MICNMPDHILTVESLVYIFNYSCMKLKLLVGSKMQSIRYTLHLNLFTDLVASSIAFNLFEIQYFTTCGNHFPEFIAPESFEASYNH